MLGQWRLSRIGSVAATVLLLANCAVGPDFQQPAAPDVTGYAPQPLAEQTSSADVKGGEAQRLVQDLDIPGQWWTLFHSAALNALVEQALKNNPSLPAAEAALRQAWENVYAAEGAFFPTAVASYSPSRNKTATGVTFTSASSGSPFFTLHTAQVVGSRARSRPKSSSSQAAMTAP
jgi:outer membrane protein TolC